MPVKTRPVRFPNLAATLAARGVTLTALAVEVELHAGTLGQIIRGHTEPSERTRRRIAEALDVPEAELFAEAVAG